jgi:hypothetical protein
MPEGPNTPASPDRPALRMLAVGLGYGLILALILVSVRFDSGHTAPDSAASRTESASPRRPLVQAPDVLRQGIRTRLSNGHGEPDQGLVRC